MQPDALVARNDDLLAVDGKYLAALPVLAVEVLSPSTQRIDRLSKLSAYEEAGVASYLLVDPEVPSLHALDLVDGHYAEVGCPSAAQVWQAQRPEGVCAVEGEPSGPNHEIAAATYSVDSVCAVAFDSCEAAQEASRRSASSDGEPGSAV